MPGTGVGIQQRSTCPYNGEVIVGIGLSGICLYKGEFLEGKGVIYDVFT